MIIIVGLVILVAALVVGIAGVLGNGGTAHSVSHFSVLGYHLTGSAGTLFLSGIVVGAAGLLGLSLLLADARRTSRRGTAARRSLRQSRRETAAASQERDDLIGQRETARAHTASQPGNAARPPDIPLRSAGDHWSRLSHLSHRSAAAQTTGRSDALADQPASEVPASASDTGATGIAPAADATASASDPDVTAVSPALDAHATASAPAE